MDLPVRRTELLLWFNVARRLRMIELNTMTMVVIGIKE